MFSAADRPISPRKMTSHLRIQQICDQRKNGQEAAHACDINTDGNITWSRHRCTQKGVVDHYKKIVYCDIPKSGTTSWFEMFQKLTERERLERKKWFSEHPYNYNFVRNFDRWK